MIKKKRVLSIITAIGGSKGLPNKNIKLLKGKHLIYYTIKASLNCGYVDKTIVTTDSLKIANISKKYGAEIPFIRPKYLAKDTSHHPEVIKHALNFLETKNKEVFDIIVMLQPTSPFRTSKHLSIAIKKFCMEKNKSLISLKEQDYPPWWLFKTSGKKILNNFNWKNKNVFNMERQEFPKLFRPNGAIYITTSKNFKKTGNLVDQKSCGYFKMKAEDSIDIDSEIDLKVAELTR